MRYLNRLRGVPGLRGWKARDAVHVAAHWNPAEGLTAVVCQTGAARPQVLARRHLPQAQSSATAVADLAQALSAGRLPWVWVLGREDYLLLVMDKPPLPQSEMRGGIAWALEPRLDFPCEQACVAWMDIPQPGPVRDTQQIYAVASRSTTVNQARDLFDAARLPLTVVDIPETAQRNLAALVEREDECLAMLSFEPAGALLTFTWRGELYLNRFIAQPLKDIDLADAAGLERIVDRLANGYRQSLDFLARQYPFLRVSRLVVGPQAAGWDLAPRLAQALAQAVEPMDLSQWVDFGAQDAPPEPAEQARLWRVLGASLRPEAPRA